MKKRPGLAHFFKKKKQLIHTGGSHTKCFGPSVNSFVYAPYRKERYDEQFSCFD